MKADAAYIGSLATRALLAEAEATPKPGLVDRMTSGAHRDMDIHTFRTSAAAIAPYLTAFAVHGAAAYAKPPETLLAGIRPLGLEAEWAMLAATDGINSHKGAIYLFGILCFSCGRLLGAGQTLTVDAVCEDAAKIALPALDAFSHADADTHGLRAYRATGALGARGEAAYGFPHVRELALPVYRSLLGEGVCENDALCHTLMQLVAKVEDTNAIHRAGPTGAAHAAAEAHAFLARYGLCAGSAPWRAALISLDADFTAQNISHGGCADLLAVTWFLDRLG